MKIIRLLLLWFGLAVVLAGLLLAAAFSSVVQTWFVRRMLAAQPGLQAGVGSVSVGFSKVRIEDLQLRRGAVSLSAPSLEIELPVVAALRARQATLQRIVAKGWLVKFDGTVAAPSQPAAGPTGAVETTASAGGPTPAVAAAFAGLLGGLEFPCDVAIDAAELEGDVLLALPRDTDKTSVHVSLKGGGLAAGGVGAFSLEASTFDLRLPGKTLRARGELEVAMPTPRRIGRVEAKGTVTAGDAAQTGETSWAFELGAARNTNADGEAYRAILSRDGRRLAEATADWSAATGNFSGGWYIDWRDTDLGALAAEANLPCAVLAGRGRFDADGDFSRLRAAGQLHAAGRRWKVIAPWLERVGEMTVDATFDFSRAGRTIRVAEASVTLTGAHPIAEARTLQAFEFDEDTGGIKVADTAAGWLDVTVRKVPLAWFAGSTKAFALEGGDVAGEFTMGWADGACTLRSKKPFTVDGVSIRHGERRLARGLDLSVSVEARREDAGQAWQLDLTPLVVSHAGQKLATIEAKMLRAAGREQPIAVKANWSADLSALTSAAVVPDLEWLTARSASGDLSGTIAGYADLVSKLTVVGHDPSHTLSATVRADLYTDGTVAIVAPMKFEFGQDISDVRIDWEWRGDAPAMGVDLKLAGQNVALAHVRLLAPPLLAFGGGRTATAAAARDGWPAWGDWHGRVAVAIERLRLVDRELVDVGGYLKIDRRGIELMGGHGGPEEHSLSQVNGTLSFDPARELPYELKGTAGTAQSDAEKVFGTPPAGKDPVFKGRFTVDRAIAAKGANLADLIARREEEFKLASANGIVRMLKTGVAQALPSAPESAAVVNALGDVGTAFGRLLGAKTKSVMSGQVKVSAATDAVLAYDSEMAEVGYDKLAITAIRRADGTIRLAQIEMVSPDLHYTGTGEMGGEKDAALIDRPLSAEMRFGARGRIAELLEKAGLLTEKKDALGYRLVAEPIQFRGTLARLNQDAWRTKLVEAAPRKTGPTPAKK